MGNPSVMIRFAIGDFGQRRWAEATAAFRDPSLLQSWEYGEARARDGRWRVERGLLTEGERVIGAAQVMVRKLPVIGGGLAWLSRGPLWRRSDAEPASVLGQVLQALRRHYAEDRGLYFRVAPPVPENDPACAVFASAGFGSTSALGWASAILDLAPAETDLRAGLRQKWRNSLNKAERLGVAIEYGTDDRGFTFCLDDYRELLAARGFETGVTPELLSDLQSALPEDRKLVHYRARHEGRIVGFAVMARYGERCEYLIGNIDDAGRRAGAGQLLLWRAVCDMKARGHAAFDLGGMDRERTAPGIFRFKDGLGGTSYRLAPEIEASSTGLRDRLVRWRVTRARRDESGARAA